MNDVQYTRDEGKEKHPGRTKGIRFSEIDIHNASHKKGLFYQHNADPRLQFKNTNKQEIINPAIYRKEKDNSRVRRQCR